MRIAPACALLAMLCAGHAGAAELQAWVDRMHIDITDTVRLAVRYSGNPGNDQPDFDAILGADFEILGTRTEQQYSIVNGRSSASLTWWVTLEPKHVGRIEIPAIDFGGGRSRPIVITVSPQNPALQREIEAQAFFETTVSAERIPVQAQLLYVIRLYYSTNVQLFGEMPAPPDLPNAIVQPLGNARPSETVRDGRRFSVIEQRYAIFPQRTGNIDLPPVHVIGSAWIHGQRKRIEIRSTAHRVEVVSPPGNYPATVPWLPAHDLEIIEAWSETPPHLEVGKTLTRTILVTARGQLASMLPDRIALAPDALRHYPDPAQNQETPSADGMVATRTFSAAVVPESGGIAHFEPVEITWYDMDDGQIRTARLAGRDLSIAGTASTASAEPSTATVRDAPPVPAAAPPVDRPGSAARHSLWPYASGFFAFAWLLTTWLLLRRRPGEATSKAAPLPDDPDDALIRLRKACRGGSPNSAYRALRAWAACRYRCPPSQALVRLRREFPRAGALEDLEATLFGGGGEFDGMRLVSWVESLPPRGAVAGKPAALPPLYPMAVEGTAGS